MAFNTRRLHMCFLHGGLYELVRYIPRVLRKESAIFKLHIYHRMDWGYFNILSVCYICGVGGNA